MTVQMFFTDRFTKRWSCNNVEEVYITCIICDIFLIKFLMNTANCHIKHNCHQHSPTICTYKESCFTFYVTYNTISFLELVPEQFPYSSHSLTKKKNQVKVSVYKRQQDKHQQPSLIYSVYSLILTTPVWKKRPRPSRLYYQCWTCVYKRDLQYPFCICEW